MQRLKRLLGVYPYIRELYRSRYYNYAQIWLRAMHDPERKVTAGMLKRFFQLVYGPDIRTPEYSSKEVLLYASFFIVRIFGLHRLEDFYPAHIRIFDMDITTKEAYTQERRAFRIFHSVINKTNQPLHPKDYETYKFIAQKYNWRYTKESYDEDI